MFLIFLLNLFIIISFCIFIPIFKLHNPITCALTLYSDNSVMIFSVIVKLKTSYWNIQTFVIIWTIYLLFIVNDPIKLISIPYLIKLREIMRTRSITLTSTPRDNCSQISWTEKCWIRVICNYFFKRIRHRSLTTFVTTKY